MIFLLRTLSVSYLTKHAWKSAFAVLGIAMGIATFVSVRTSQHTLVSGFRTTIDRLAGDTQVQVTALGGVPEEVRETLRALPVVDLEEPVIEQVVQPSQASAGTLLVFAIDLVGDRGVRQYQFSGEDADVDDPLVFLAQPDSIALSREFAARLGVKSGDTLTVRFGGAPKTLSVRALLEPKGFARAYGGNIAITDVYAAQTIFGRGRRFDRIDVRLQPNVKVEDALVSIAAALGPGYVVETPERRGAQVEHMVSAFVGTFNILSMVALGIGLYMISNVFTVAVHRRRRDIGILRAVGVTPRQVGMLFLAEAVLLGVIGSAAGILLGTRVAASFLDMMSSGLTTFYGLSEETLPVLTPALMAEALAMGAAAALVGAWTPAREAARVPPTSAIATGVFNVRTPVSPWLAIAGVSLIAMAFAIGRFGLIHGSWLIFIVTGAGALGATLLAGPAARLLIRPTVPILARLMPVTGRIAAEGLLGHPRRTSGTAAVLIVSMAFVLGSAGYLRALTSTVGRWVDDMIQADLIVRASTGLGPSAVRLPSNARALALATPGVAAVDPYRNERTEYRQQPVALVAIDGKGFVAHTRREFVAGNDDAFLTGMSSRQECVVSDNFARRFQHKVGDTVVLTSPTGPVRLTIGAVVVNFVSDRGTILVDAGLFASRWKNDQLDALYVMLAPGASVDRVRELLRTGLTERSAALVSTRREYRTEVNDALESFQVLIRAVVLMALVIALMGVVTSLWVSVGERTRDIGVLKALGVRHAQIGGAVVLESVTLTVASLALAVPLGALLSWFLRARVSENYAGFRFPAAYPLDTLTLVLTTLPLVAIIGAWLPARWAASLNIADAIAYE